MCCRFGHEFAYHAWDSSPCYRCDGKSISGWKVNRSPTAELVGLVEETAGEGNREVPRTFRQMQVAQSVGDHQITVTASSRGETDPTGRLLAYRRRADDADLPALVLTSPQDRIYVRGE